MAAFVELSVNGKTTLINVDAIVTVTPSAEGATILIKDTIGGKPMLWPVSEAYDAVRTKLRDAAFPPT